MEKCKNCQSGSIVRNGKVRGVQRYKCKEWGYNFVQADKRIKQSTQVKKALAVMLYSIGKASFRFLSKLFSRDVSLVYRWIRDEGEAIKEPIVSGDIQKIEFDEMWHFIQSKKQKMDHQGPGL
jgi:transposase